MANDFDLRQAAVDCLHGMLKGRRRLSKVKGEIALEVLGETREAQEAKQPPEWVQQLLVETALENERERRGRWKD